MQPFDRSVFDKRYDDVFAPAISAAGLVPYRVDRDPDVSIPINEIETGIQNSAVCLAEITLDNPNVWFELGYAIACNKPVVLVCSAERTSKFPFDVQHRSIITYKPESPRDFAQLQEAVTTHLQALMKRERQIAKLAASPVQETAGLEPHEIAALVTIMESGLNADPPSAYSVTTDMERTGYRTIAAVLGVKRLISLAFVEEKDAENYNGESYTGYVVTDSGEAWLLKNQDKLAMRKKQTTYDDFRAPDDDLPF